MIERMRAEKRTKENRQYGTISEERRRKWFLCIQRTGSVTYVCWADWLGHMTIRFDEVFSIAPTIPYAATKRRQSRTRVFAKHSFISHNFLMLFSLSHSHFNHSFLLRLLLWLFASIFVAGSATYSYTDMYDITLCCGSEWKWRESMVCLSSLDSVYNLQIEHYIPGVCVCAVHRGSRRPSSVRRAMVRGKYFSHFNEIFRYAAKVLLPHSIVVPSSSSSSSTMLLLLLLSVPVPVRWYTIALRFFYFIYFFTTTKCTVGLSFLFSFLRVASSSSSSSSSFFIEICILYASVRMHDRVYLFFFPFFPPPLCLQCLLWAHGVYAIQFRAAFAQILICKIRSKHLGNIKINKKENAMIASYDYAQYTHTHRMRKGIRTRQMRGNSIRKQNMREDCVFNGKCDRYATCHIAL